MHRVIEGLLGIGLVILPVLFGFSPSAFMTVSVQVVVAAALIGIFLTVLGFAGGRRGNATGLRLHILLERIVLAALLIAAAIAYATGDRSGALLLAVAALIYGGLHLLTRFDFETLAPQQSEVQPAEVPEQVRVPRRTVEDP